MTWRSSTPRRTWHSLPKVRLSLRDRHPSLPSWGLDGGGGSVVSVYAMEENQYETRWKILKAVLAMFGGYSVDLSDVRELMDTLELEL